MSHIITVDGPSASGKSTVGFLLAQKIGYQFIDSGLIYRVATLLSQRQNIDPTDGDKIAEAINSSKIQFQTEDQTVKIFLNGEDVTAFLKTPQIDNLVPIIAAHNQVREATKGVQREVGLAQNTVMAGRDIGSEIFPEAIYKFFITASVEARAKRRFDQLIKTHPEVSLEDIEQEIKKRDQIDSTRKASPMRIPEGAIIIDTSNLKIDEVVEKLLNSIKPEISL